MMKPSENAAKTGYECDPDNIVITAGGTEGMFDALLATTDPGDEVILTDPTYAGMIYRARLAGAVAKLVPFRRLGGCLPGLSQLRLQISLTGGLQRLPLAKDAR